MLQLHVICFFSLVLAPFPHSHSSFFHLLVSLATGPTKLLTLLSLCFSILSFVFAYANQQMQMATLPVALSAGDFFFLKGNRSSSEMLNAFSKRDVQFLSIIL